MVKMQQPRKPKMKSEIYAKTHFTGKTLTRILILDDLQGALESVS